MTVAFLPARAPSRTSPGASVQASVLSADFGDGFRQRTAPGINSVKETHSLTWDTVPLADGTSIIEFFESMRGITAFLYAIPPSGRPKKWTCETWQYSESGPGLMKITAEFKQAFDPS